MIRCAATKQTQIGGVIRLHQRRLKIILFFISQEFDPMTGYCIEKNSLRYLFRNFSNLFDHRYMNIIFVASAQLIASQDIAVLTALII
jgi:hypothetical protein